MASIDDSQSLWAASDEKFDHVCGLCQKTDGKEKEAKQYCNDCSEYLCDSCMEYHIKFPLLKNHTIVGVNRVSVDSGKRFTVYCGCNKNQKVEFYCKEHDDVVCTLCNSFMHHNCHTSPIQQKSSGYTTEKLESVISRTKSLKDKYDHLKLKCGENKNELKLSKEICMQEIKAFRKELDSCLDGLEQKMLAELEQLETKEQLRIDQHITTLTTALHMLETDYHTLDAAKNDGRTHVMFATDIQTSKGLQGCASRLADLEKDIKKLILSFENNRKLINMQKDVTTLGTLNVIEKMSERRPETGLLLQQVESRRPKTVFLHQQVESRRPKTVLLLQQVESRRPKTVLLDQQVESHRPKTVLLHQQVESRRPKRVLLDQRVRSRTVVKVKLTNDENAPLISGCVVMPNDYVVICDRNKLKLLDNNLSVTESCQMSDPYDVSVLDANNVIVTSPEQKILQIVQIFPQLKLGRAIQLDKRCCGVEVSGENIYVSCGDRHVVEVIVLDKCGNIQRRLECGKSKYALYRSSYITVSRDGDKIFVSKPYNNTITCMAADGTILYTNKDLICPRGLYCDDSGNILVCSSQSNTVQMITAEGKLHNTMLSSKDGLNSPYSVVYRHSDNVLIVGCGSLDHLLVYHLAQ